MSGKGPPFRLRPHHLLCVQGYRGKGYDDRFRETMGRIARTLAEDPSLPVTVTDGPDDVCRACPHLRDGRCTWDQAGEAAVREHDAALLAAFRIADGDVTTIRDVARKVATDANVSGVVARYCGPCPWVSDCAFAARWLGPGAGGTERP